MRREYSTYRERLEDVSSRGAAERHGVQCLLNSLDIIVILRLDFDPIRYLEYGPSCHASSTCSVNGASTMTSRRTLTV